MFDFLKKKLKDSLDSLKKTFGGEEQKAPVEEKKEEKVVPIPETIEEVREEPKNEVPKEEVQEESLSAKLARLRAQLNASVPEEAPEEEKPVPEAFSKEVAEKIEEIKAVEDTKIISEELKKEPVVEQKKGFFGKIFGKKEEKPIEEIKTPVSKSEDPKKKGLFTALFEKKLSEDEFEKFFAPLEISLMESNLAYEVIQLLRERLKGVLVNSQIPRGKSEEIVTSTMLDTFREVLVGRNPHELLHFIGENKKKGVPTKILFLGVNGVGKTTSLAKMAYWLRKCGYSCVFAAADTFRAASMEQLEKHASNLGDNIKVIKHKYGGDPAAVAFDAIEHAKAKGVDVVLIDSAGRQHTNVNLMDELQKVKRVAKPDFSIFVADALTGNDAVEQAREFGSKIGFDMIILGKADVDEKGGAILSVSYVSNKPILFLGVGQGYEDLKPFDKEEIIAKIMH